MKTMSHYLVLAGGLSIVAGVATLTFADLAEGQGKRPSTPVTVVNSPAEPVPVVQKGASVVEGQVEAQQAGPWTVGVNNLPAVQNVNVLNDALRVIGTAPPLARGGGNFLLERYGEGVFFDLPPGIVLTDVSVSVDNMRLVPGAVCTDARVNIVENRGTNLHVYFVPRATSDRLHLQSGLQPSSPADALQIYVTVWEDAYCVGHVMWTGYLP